MDVIQLFLIESGIRFHRCLRFQLSFVCLFRYSILVIMSALRHFDIVELFLHLGAHCAHILIFQVIPKLLGLRYTLLHSIGLVSP